MVMVVVLDVLHIIVMAVELMAQTKADVTRRVNDAIAAGLIGKDESAPIIDHMIWEEVNAEVNIGYRRIRRKNDAV
jgi:hypothetical protein